MTEQDQVHTAIEQSLELEDGKILTGWIVIYETASADGRSSAGHLYGPAGMTTWRAMGLAEWASRVTLVSSVDDDDDDDE